MDDKKQEDQLPESEQAEFDPLTDADWHELKSNFGILHGKESKNDRSHGLTRTQKLVAYAISLGWTQVKIAEKTGLHTNTINRWVNSDSFKRYLHAVTYVNAPARINEYLKEEITSMARIISDIAKNPSVKPEIRLQAAKTVFNQVLGDPKQTHELISLRDVYDQLDRSSTSTTEEPATTEEKKPEELN